MSYILDALKKSDIQAQKGKLPSIHSHADLTQAAQRPVWQAMLGGSLITILMIIAVMQLIPRMKSSEPEQNSISNLVSGRPQATPLSPPAHPTAAAPAPAPTFTPTPTKTVPGPEILPAKKLKPVSESPLPASSRFTPLAKTPTPEKTETPSRKAHQQPVLRSELPIAVQQALPPIEISGHIFDNNPAARMVFINGRIQHQGDSISPQLKLTAITASGVEMIFRGTLFRIDIIRR